LLRGGGSVIIGPEGFVQVPNSKLIISFIPSHRYRHYFVKGYNQSQLLAKKLSEILHVPIVEIAKKQKHTKTQASLDRNGRLHNLKNAFSLVKNTQLTGNETLLIVDDITTTGSTINELAKLMKYHYPKIKVR
jgi:ComF family protein